MEIPDKFPGFVLNFETSKHRNLKLTYYNYHVKLSKMIVQHIETSKSKMSYLLS